MNFTVSQDLNLACFLLNISLEDAAREMNIERITLFRIHSGETYPNPKTIDQIYNYIYSKGIKIHEIKSWYYDDELLEGKLLLHGSKSFIDGEISPFKGRKTSDFGQAFYCAESVEQTTSFISKFEDSSLYILDFDEKDLKKYEFEVNQEWMLAVAYFRGTIEKYKNHPKIMGIINKIKNVDYVIAPIADNRMFRIIDQFISGLITDEQCLHSLASTNLGKQYAILTEKAASHIKIMERCYICSKERKHFEKTKESFNQESVNITKEIMKEYRNKGEYIEEILDETN